MFTVIGFKNSAKADNLVPIVYGLNLDKDTAKALLNKLRSNSVSCYMTPTRDVDTSTCQFNIACLVGKANHKSVNVMAMTASERARQGITLKTYKPKQARESLPAFLR